ncbi:Protein of unknown function (DUF3529) [Synechococcus sp. PCC 7502]|nr:Protein of unknown function (DUF3529) [Synechococcus sp. PCC 7502]
MDFTDQVLTSTLLLTVLLLVGLLSFLRSSVKDRTTEMILKSVNFNEDQLLSKTRDHFKQRGYQVIKLEGDRETVTLAGRVRPSIFLTLVLVVVAAIGMGCLGLVLTILVPFFSDNWLAIAEIAVFTAIGAGLFYWNGADRIEEISLQLRPNTQLWVKGHKDELAELQRSLGLIREA